MCEKCVKAVDKYFPDCPLEFYGDFLITSTAFPAGSPETIEAQLKELKDAGCATWQEATNLASDNALKAMSNNKEKSQSPRRKRVVDSKGGTGTDKSKEQQRLDKNEKERKRYRKNKEK
jgi:hypothetical protein